MLVVEQNAAIALATADHGYVDRTRARGGGGQLRGPLAARRHQGVLPGWRFAPPAARCRRRHPPVRGRRSFLALSKGPCHDTRPPNPSEDKPCRRAPGALWTHIRARRRCCRQGTRPRHASGPFRAGGDRHARDPQRHPDAHRRGQRGRRHQRPQAPAGDRGQREPAVASRARRRQADPQGRGLRPALPLRLGPERGHGEEGGGCRRDLLCALCGLGPGAPGGRPNATAVHHQPELRQHDVGGGADGQPAIWAARRSASSTRRARLATWSERA